MTDAEIKQALKDASLYLSDAAKAWPRYRGTAWIRFAAANEIIHKLQDKLERES